jgi:hypothetical protein
MKCPHLTCQRDIFKEDLPDIDKAEQHAAHYGDGFTVSKCPFCHRKFKFYAERKIAVYEPFIACESDDLSYD